MTSTLKRVYFSRYSRASLLPFFFLPRCVFSLAHFLLGGQTICLGLLWFACLFIFRNVALPSPLTLTPLPHSSPSHTVYLAGCRFWRTLEPVGRCPAGPPYRFASRHVCLHDITSRRCLLFFFFASWHAATNDLPLLPGGFVFFISPGWP